MNKEDLEKLNEYDRKLIVWSIERGAVSQHIENNGFTANQNHWPVKKPWPLTEEESSHWNDLHSMLTAECELASDNSPRHLLFLAPPVQGQGVKFAK